MKTCKDETGAKRYPDVHAAIDAADSYNEWRSPHIFGRMAQVMSGSGVYAVGVFTTDTKVLTGFLAEAGAELCA